MKEAWGKLVKWAAGKAFQWGLKKLTEKNEQAPSERPSPVLRRSGRNTIQ